MRQTFTCRKKPRQVIGGVFYNCLVLKKLGIKSTSATSKQKSCVFVIHIIKKAVVLVFIYSCII
jgi:hypothetical protein